MFIRPGHHDWESIKWAAIVVLTVALTLAWTSVLGALENLPVALL